MKKNNFLYLAILGILVLGVFTSSAYLVEETEQVIITQFGKPIGKPVTEPGIHFKIPLIQDINRFDKRFLAWDGDRNQVPTRDKRFIWVDTYARWRISDPLLFFQRLSDESRAQSRLDDILDGETRNAIANNELVELIRSTDRKFQVNVDLAEGEKEFNSKIKVGRHKITRSILEAAAPKAAELGIELLDLRFKRIKYVDEVQQKIFERMITERKRIADEYRSEGQGEAAKIIGDKGRELKQIQSEAFKEAEEIKGDADAEATTIYASAYNRNLDTRDFYRFLKTMETYENVLTEKDFMLLSTDSDFFKYLRHPSGRSGR